MRYFVSLGDAEHCVEVRAEGEDYWVDGAVGPVRVRVLGAQGSYRVHIGERVIDLTLRSLGRERAQGYAPLQVQALGQKHDVKIASERDISGTAGRVAKEHEERGIVAPMPGRVLQVRVKTGDRVPKGTALLVLEAMKMENEVYADADAVVLRVLVKPGDTVEAQAPLLFVDCRS